MKQIVLKQVLIKNFRSYKEECITFPETIGLKLLSGQNLAEPRLGANAAGKSSCWEAVCWVNFGSGVKGAKTASLLSWNMDQIEVLAEYIINNQLHSVYRSGPPMKIELDGKPATQEQIDTLLGLTKEQFLHSVMFGQGVDLFPDLPIPKRGEILDTVLGLSVWEKASEAATSKVTSLRESIVEKEKELAHLNGQLTQFQSEEYIQAQIDDWEDVHGDEITNCQKDLKEWEEAKESRLKEIQSQIDEWREKKKSELQDRAEELDTLERQLSPLEGLILELSEPIDTSPWEILVQKKEKDLEIAREEYIKVEAERQRIQSDKQFWLENVICPSCKQPITALQKEEYFRELEEKEQELVSGLDVFSNSIEDIKLLLQDKKKELDFIKAQIVQKEEQKRGYTRDIKRIEAQICGIETITKGTVLELEQNRHPYLRQLNTITVEGNPYSSQLKQLKARVNHYIALLDKTREEKKTLENKKDVLTLEIRQVEKSIVAAEYWKHGFKRIRLFFIEQILATLQIEIQSAISMLGLENWLVRLSTESETKSGTTKLGVQISIKSPTSEGNLEIFSGGEAQRLRLGIALGLGSLIQRASGTFYNWEVLDEPGQHLSEQGIEDLLQALQYRAESLKKSIWVTHHSALIYSGFKEIWLALKEPSGSSSIRLISEVGP